MHGLTPFEAELERVVALLSPGEVVSYGDIADVAGRPGAARAAGAFLAHAGGDLPWWRVVYGDGRLPPVNEREQARRLRAEGVVVRGGRVIASPAGRFSRPAPRRSGEQPRRRERSRPRTRR